MRAHAEYLFYGFTPEFIRISRSFSFIFLYVGDADFFSCWHIIVRSQIVETGAAVDLKVIGFSFGCRAATMKRRPAGKTLRFEHTYVRMNETSDMSWRYGHGIYIFEIFAPMLGGNADKKHKKWVVF